MDTGLFYFVSRLQCYISDSSTYRMSVSGMQQWGHVGKLQNKSAAAFWSDADVILTGYYNYAV